MGGGCSAEIDAMRGFATPPPPTPEVFHVFS